MPYSLLAIILISTVLFQSTSMLGLNHNAIMLPDSFLPLFYDRNNHEGRYLLLSVSIIGLLHIYPKSTASASEIFASLIV